MKVHDILLTDADYLFSNDLGADSVEVPQYTESEISEALATQTLTAEQCVYLHEQGINWQINVGGV